VEVPKHIPPLTCGHHERGIATSPPRTPLSPPPLWSHIALATHYGREKTRSNNIKETSLEEIYRDICLLSFYVTVTHLLSPLPPSLPLSLR